MPTQNPIVLLIFFYVVGALRHATRSQAGAAVRTANARPPAARQLLWIGGVLIALAYARGPSIVLAHGALSPSNERARSRRGLRRRRLPARATAEWAIPLDRSSERDFLLQAPLPVPGDPLSRRAPDAGQSPVSGHTSRPRARHCVDRARRPIPARANLVLELPGRPGPFVEFVTDVSRTWRPSRRSTEADSRELGAAIETDLRRIGPDDVDLPTSVDPAPVLRFEMQ